MYATLPISEPGLKKIVTGSHCDSVKNGGNYDGILGVIGAMEVLETIVANKIPHRHDIVAMIWTNPEGSLYPPAMMSSGIVCTEYLPESLRSNFAFNKMMISTSVEDGITTFGEKLSTFKYKGDKKNRLNPKDYMCDFELHREQGPILEDAGKTVGIVDCVLGMFNYRISFTGQAAHAGTFPMDKRKDGLFAASQALCYLHEEIDKLNRPELVYTTGEILCHPCVHTVIPDYVEFSLDVRHEDPKVLESVRKIVLGLADKEWAGCTCQVNLAWERDTVYWNKQLVDFVQQSADELKIPNMPIHSGAGHDAQFVAYMIPTTMIFVVTKDGLSHCEPEFASDEQCTEGASVLLNAILKADKLDDISK